MYCKPVRNTSGFNFTFLMAMPRRFYDIILIRILADKTGIGRISTLSTAYFLDFQFIVVSVFRNNAVYIEILAHKTGMRCVSLFGTRRVYYYVIVSMSRRFYITICIFIATHITKMSGKAFMRTSRFYYNIGVIMPRSLYVVVSVHVSTKRTRVFGKTIIRTSRSILKCFVFVSANIIRLCCKCRSATCIAHQRTATQHGKGKSQYRHKQFVFSLFQFSSPFFYLTALACKSISSCVILSI